MSLITTKSDQQNHSKFVYSHGPVCCGLKGSLHQGVPMELKFTRRRVTEETRETVQSRKVLHFNQRKCYTSLEGNVDSKACFSTSIHFNWSHSHLSHGKRSPVKTALWGLAPTPDNSSFTWTGFLKFLWHTMHCTASGLGFSRMRGLRCSPASFRKFRMFCVCRALLLLPKCNTTIWGISGWCYLPQWNERLFHSKYRGQLIHC